MPRDAVIRKRTETQEDYKDAPSRAQNFEEYHKSSKFREPFHIKGDGHCLIYSITDCMLEYQESHYKYNEEEVISNVRDKIVKNSLYV